MCFVLFLFVTCFGWNFNAIAAAAAAETFTALLTLSQQNIYPERKILFGII
jgi:hypothetical protein